MAMAIRFRARIDKRSSEIVVKKLQALQDPVTKIDAKDIGEQSLSKMKELISKGISPVKGPSLSTRFPAYLHPERYPGNRKNKSPVNLYLTGKFLADLQSKVINTASGWRAEIGYNKQSEKVKEKGHRHGANGQPSRPTIPQVGLGETFASTIQQVYLKLFNSSIKRIIDRKS